MGIHDDDDKPTSQRVYVDNVCAMEMCTGEAGYDSYGGYAGNIPVDGHQYRNSCSTCGINSEADDT